jgi:hypothetical protein
LENKGRLAAANSGGATGRNFWFPAWDGWQKACEVAAMKSICPRRVVSPSFAVHGALCLLVLWRLASAPDVEAGARGPLPPLPESAPVLWHEAFDAPYHQGVIEARVWWPDYGVLNESWSGYALECSGPGARPLVVPAVRAEGRLNLATEAAGALRFWVKPHWSGAAFGARPGPGRFACLAELGAGSGDRSGVCWSLRVNPEGSLLVLAARGEEGMVELLRAPISWRAGAPHLISLNFGPEGTSLYVDARLAAEGTGTVPVGPADSRLSLGGSLEGTDVAEADFDEVFSFGAPLTADELAFYYRATWNAVVAGSVYPAEPGGFSRPLSALTAEAATGDSGGPPLPPGAEEGGGDGGGGSVTNFPPLWTLGAGLCLYPVAFVSSHSLTLSLTNTPDSGWLTNAYDLFYTTNLAGLSAPALCVSNWAWLARSNPGQTNFVVSNLSFPQCYFRLGTMRDSDNDGLPDAYEAMVSHTDPNFPEGNGDADGDGYSNREEFQNGTSPTKANARISLFAPKSGANIP